MHPKCDPRSPCAEAARTLLSRINRGDCDCEALTASIASGASPSLAILTVHEAMAMLELQQVSYAYDEALRTLRAIERALSVTTVKHVTTTADTLLELRHLGDGAGILAFQQNARYFQQNATSQWARQPDPMFLRARQAEGEKHKRDGLNASLHATYSFMASG